MVCASGLCDHFRAGGAKFFQRKQQLRGRELAKLASGVEAGAAGKWSSDGARISRPVDSGFAERCLATKLPRPTWPVIRPSDSSSS